MKVGDLVEFVDRPNHLPADIHLVGVVVEVHLASSTRFGVSDAVRVLWDNGDREMEHPPKLKVVKT